MAVLLCSTSRLASAQTEPSPAQLVSGFVYAGGESGEVGCLPAAAIEEPLLTATTRALDAAGIDPDFAVLLTAGVLSCPSIFYMPVKNDVSGIGYQRERLPELFDDAPGRALQGIAFLNDLPYWLENPGEFESAFLHELGHRWLARVHAELDGDEVVLTGREGDHWSYFLDTGGSPLEGNVWQDGADPDVDAPHADTPLFPLRFSPLDLYLMGAAGPDEVAPFRLLVPTETDALDCYGRPLGAASPPQTCGSLDVSGSWLSIGVDDVIALEGERVPAAGEAPQRLSLAFVLLDPGKTGFGEAECGQIGTWAQRLTELFGTATDGRLALENAAVGGVDCTDLQLAEARPASGGCELTLRRERSGGAALGLTVLAALLGLAARRRAGSLAARS